MYQDKIQAVTEEVSKGRRRSGQNGQPIVDWAFYQWSYFARRGAWFGENFDRQHPGQSASFGFQSDSVYPGSFACRLGRYHDLQSAEWGF